MGRTVEDRFKKRFQFIGNHNWYIPPVAYKSPPWQIDSFQQMKTELNRVKGQLSSLNLDEWSEYTKSRDPSTVILQELKAKSTIEVLTQAWIKMYECLMTYDIIPRIPSKDYILRSLHLCEAPGAFVSALNHFLATFHSKPTWEWTANSLNPYYEGNSLISMIADDRLIKYTYKNWYFGIDQTGDLTRYWNHEDVVQHCMGRKFVTADGSVNCMDNPGEQENTVHFIHYCETMTALRVLNKSGRFVIKVFTMFEHGTICLMYLLTCVFKQVHVYKPSCSKSGNSEVYVICLDFKGSNIIDHLWPSILKPYRREVKIADFAMFPLDSIHPDFISQLKKCCQFFKDEQCFTINENVKFFKSGFDNLEYKNDFLSSFRKRYKIMPFVRNNLKLIKKYRSNTLPRFNNDNMSFQLDSRQLENYSLTVIPIIGKALTKVLSSRFVPLGQCTNLVVIDEDELLKEIENELPKEYNVIKYSSLSYHLPHYLFQKEFVFALLKSINDFKNIVIVGMPILTRLLVDILLITALSYEVVTVYRKGIMVFKNPIKSQFETLTKAFNNIVDTYSSLNVDKYVFQFEPDLLQLLDDKHLYCCDFCNLVCKYNEGMFGPKRSLY